MELIESCGLGFRVSRVSRVLLPRSRLVWLPPSLEERALEVELEV